MDLRKQKTRQSIRAAFLQLRQTNAPEQIAVKDLAQLAQISKATFYLHYRDIYDLGEQLQLEAITELLCKIPDPMIVLDDFAGFMEQMVSAIAQDHAGISLLFSGPQMVFFPIRLETQLKKYIFDRKPELEKDDAFNVQLSYHIHGGYYAYMQHESNLGSSRVKDNIYGIYKSVSSLSRNK